MSGLNDVAKEAGLNPAQCEKCNAKMKLDEPLQLFFDTIIARCAAGETVRIGGFGTFKARLHKGRTLKSPLLEDGEVTYDDALVLRFSSSLVAKRKLNELGEVKKSKPAKKTGKKVAKKVTKKTKKG